MYLFQESRGLGAGQVWQVAQVGLHKKQTHTDDLNSDKNTALLKGVWSLERYRVEVTAELLQHRLQVVDDALHAVVWCVSCECW